MPRFLLKLLFFLAAISATLHAQSRIDCSEMNSGLLKQPMHYCVFLPGSYDKPEAKTQRYPILYFLHGLGDNEQTLFKSGGWTLIDDLRHELKIGDFLLVAPEGKRSFYINSANGKMPYSDFFLQEFIPYIEAKYRVRPGQKGRAITGVSMGGYGALKIAMKHPDLFGSASAHSAVLLQDLSAAKVSAGRLQRFQAMFDKIYGINQDLTYWEANNPLTLAKDTRKLNGLKLHFDCGTEDRLIIANIEFVKLLMDKQVPFTYAQSGGGHNAPYWTREVGHSMAVQFAIMERSLGKTPTGATGKKGP